jgi:NAD-dependent DNA ligase
MNRLEVYLNKCAREYYSGAPSISDEVFDALAEAVGYNKVGAKQHENTEKHFYPMYSLQKFYEDEGKESPLKGEVNDVSPKLDGASVDLLYIDGNFTRALTRGDGIEGTLITDKFVDCPLIPQTIPIEGVMQITGEIVSPKEIENARNYAAGALMLKDIKEFYTRNITFYAYGVQPYITETFTGDMAFLKAMGFNTVKDPGLYEIYPCDGLVFRVNDNAKFYSMGYTANHPRGAYALKERGEAVETIIVGVEWNTGKSGKVTPVAILDPIKIGDKLVARATLNNIAFIRALDIRIGDRVGVILGGDIIPCITHKVE